MSDDIPAKTDEIDDDDDEKNEPETASLSLSPQATDAAFTTRVNAQLIGDRARTENRIATVLVWSVVLSLPVVAGITWAHPPTSKEFQNLFDRWITLVGPLAGAAVGIGAADRIGRKSGDL